MPFSDPTPVLVLPDTPKGREERRRYIREADAADPNGEWPGIYLCQDYAEDTDINTEQYAILRGLDVAKVNSWEIRNVCSRRDLTGDRRKQLCFRCPAGFMFFSPPDERNLKAGQDPEYQARIRAT